MAKSRQPNTAILVVLSLLVVPLFCDDGTSFKVSGCSPYSHGGNKNAEGIKCSLHTDLNVTIECPTNQRESRNVIRFLGEFGAFFMNCTAPFHLDLDYDGFRPTEAIELVIWKNLSVDPHRGSREGGNQTVDPKISVMEFGLTVKIHSVQNLFFNMREYRKNASRKQVFLNNNLTAPIIYPRTGGFKIRGLHRNNRNKSQQFYFFFEEPLLRDEITFMDNEHTLRPHFIEMSPSTAPSILIPCRPSHWTTNVSLWYRKISTVDYPTNASFEIFTLISQDFKDFFDPTTGFQLPVTALNLNISVAGDLQGIEIQCRVVSPSGKISTWAADTMAGDEGSSGDFVFGLHRLTETLDVGGLRILNQVHLTNGDQSAFLRCFLDRLPQSRDIFYSFGRPLGTLLELRYNQEIILPMFANRSYWTQQWETSENIPSIFISRANPHGVAFCRKNYTYVFQKYASGLNLKEFTFGINRQWDKLPRRTKDMENQIKIEMIEPNPANRGKLYTYSDYLFYCHNVGFSFTKPILWFVKYKNQTQVLVLTDGSLTEGVSKLRITLKRDVEHVFCLKFLWDGLDELGEIPKVLWKKASTNPLEIHDGTKPRILNKQETTTVSLGSKNLRLTCEATGDPTPSVWWEKDEQVLTKMEGSVLGTASLEIPLVDEKSLGVHICKARNGYGEEEMEIKVVVATRGASFYILAVGLPIFIFIFIVTLLLLFKSYRRKLERTRLTIQELKEFRDGVEPGSGKSLDVDGISYLSAQRYNSELYEIPEEYFSIDEKRILGSGEFGMVFRASVNGRQVAVKTTRPGAEKSYLKSLLSELKLLIYLGNHIHLISLVGASTVHLDKGILHVFVELCEGGDLLTFLQEHRDDFIDMNEAKREFKIDQLHSWAIQIAKGMNFLSSKKVIHGDLAARNVLLTAEKSAKITDLGLSRQLYTSSIYKKKSTVPLPFRWMSLEALEDLKFSCASDVWSYGILLWEIYSLGQIPYPTFNWSPEFIQNLKNGHRLSCPPLLPRRLFSVILMPCWDITPEKRPDFSTLSTTLEQMTGKSEAEQEYPETLKQQQQQDKRPKLQDEANPEAESDPQNLSSFMSYQNEVVITKKNNESKGIHTISEIDDPLYANLAPCET